MSQEQVPIVGKNRAIDKAVALLQHKNSINKSTNHSQYYQSRLTQSPLETSYPKVTNSPMHHSQYP